MGLLKKLNDEYNAIGTKIIKLRKSIKTVELDRREQELIQSQLSYMKGYREVLRRRINYEEEKFRKM